jgi:hypothetical protein
VPLLREVENIEAVFFPAPAMTERHEKYYLETNGDFLTQDGNIEFKVEYLREDGKWKLSKFRINPFKAVPK